MSYDPQSPSDAADLDDEPDGACEACGEGMSIDELNVEAFEISGQVLCPDCAATLFEGKR